MNLANVFASVAFKTLVSVDLPHLGSNQHELNGSTALRQFFGTSARTTGEIRWSFLADEQETRSDLSTFTFYDAREDHPHRTEWRMYYRGDFLAHAETGDVLIFARVTNRKDTVYGLVFQQGSQLLQAMLSLLGKQPAAPKDRTARQPFTVVAEDALARQEVEFAGRRILEQIGVEEVLPEIVGDEALVVQHFRIDATKPDAKFPSTKAMSEFAREQAEVDATDPDSTLVGWLDREESLFRALERVLVQERIVQGFRSVDDFVEFSLSVQNRRKSRMGHAFENQLAALFDTYHLRYERGKITEGKNKPDFLFPGIQEYHNSRFATDNLIMLAAKSTCKDRWRQILNEATRITSKHLCTLEAGISRPQTDSMHSHGVVLVVPAGRLFQTYSPEQQKDMLTIEQFINLAREKQKT